MVEIAGKKITATIKKFPKRGRHFANGRVESPWLIRTDDKMTRRVYEIWSRIDKRGSENPKDWSVPLAIFIKGIAYDLSNELIAELELEKDQ